MALEAVGETRQWRVARQSSLESYAFRDEVVGSPKVTKPHHSPQDKAPEKAVVLSWEKTAA